MDLTPVSFQVLIEGKRFPQYSSTCALIQVRNGEINLLFDLGSPYDKQLLLAQLAKCGLTPADIHYILSSHWHMDHLGGLDLFKQAKIITSRETAETQIALVEAVLEAEKSPTPTDTLSQILIDYLQNEKLVTIYDENYPKFRAMSNITIRNSFLLKEFAEKYRSGEVNLIEEPETLLWESLHITKLQAHTDGDLVVHIVDMNQNHFYLMGDVIISQKIENEVVPEIEDSYSQNFLSRIRVPGNYILPGHDPLFQYSLNIKS